MNELSFLWNYRQVMTSTEETTRRHLSLLLVVMGQGFILFFSVVVLLFLPRRDEDSLSITLPASFLFFDCSSSAEVLAVWDGSQSSLSPFHHAITLSVPCSNFLLHPVITVHHWGQSRSLNAGSSLCRSQSVLASLLLFGMCSQSWVSVPASSYSLSLCLSLSYSSAQSPSFLSLSLCLPTLFPLLCSVSLIWSPWFSSSECFFVWWVSHSSLWGYETFWSSTRGECLQLQYTSLWLQSAHSVVYTGATVLCELHWRIKEMQTRLPSRHTAHFISFHTPQTGQSMMAIASFTQF